MTVFQPPHACAYNIDLPSYVRHQREPNSMFGFSIAFHRGRAGYSNTNSWVAIYPSVSVLLKEEDW